MIGRSLAQYEILELLGRGGMGEVYLARDKTLGREVALKLLPEDFAQDPERLARFRREAKVLASLNHPNIAGLHGLEEDQGRVFLAMELASGVDLSERIAPGPMEQEDAVEIARQIAAGLEEAHERGVVHRDLKPANVRVSDDGLVKILDFGLARAYSGEGTGEENLADSPTISAALTQKGTILGTAAYMSPEQARGRNVDRRADIWAFGLILFEMLTGKKVFAGDTITDVLAGIIKTEPDWDSLPSDLPPHVERVLRRCLAKDPKQRLRDIGEARIRLEGDAGESSSQHTVYTPQTAGRSSRLPWAIAALAVIAAVVSFVLPHGDSGPSEQASAKEVIRFGIPMDVETRGDLGLEVANMSGNLDTGTWLDSRFFDISRDGREVAFLTAQDGEPEIAVRRLESLAVERYAAPNYIGQIFFSPSGARVGYVANASVMGITLDGGAPAELFPHGGYARGAVWDRDLEIVAPYNTDTPLFRFDLANDRVDSLTSLDGSRGIRTHRFPSALPEGRGFLLNIGNDEIMDFDDSRIGVYDARDGSLRELMQGTMPYYAPSGHLLFHRDGTIYAARFDLETLTLIGSPVPMVEGVMYRPVSGAAQYAISENGTLAYVPGGAMDARTSLSWIDRDGHREEILQYEGLIQGLTLSPDGRRAALEIDAANATIWILDLERGGISRLTYSGSSNFPKWSADGEWIYYSSSRYGHRGLYRSPADGGEEAESLFGQDASVSAMTFSVSPDEKYICVQYSEGASTVSNLGVVDLATGEFSKYVSSRFYESNPSFSPRGGWLAYVSDETGRPEIYLRRFPEGDRKHKVSSGMGLGIRWSADGEWLFYMTPAALMRVHVQYEPELKLGIPEEFLRVAEKGIPLGRGFFTFQDFDLSPQADRILLARELGVQALPDRIEIVVNWLEELRAALPE